MKIHLKINTSKYITVRNRHDSGNLEARKTGFGYHYSSVYRKCGSETTDYYQVHKNDILIHKTIHFGWKNGYNWKFVDT